MDYENKYNNIVDTLQSLIADGKKQGHIIIRIEDIENAIPELKEREDEESKKWILEYLYDGLRRSDEQFKEEFKCAIAWLEKQGDKSLGKTELDEVLDVSPELKETEKVKYSGGVKETDDKKIIKYLIEEYEYLLHQCGDSDPEVNGISYSKIIAWLENLTKKDIGQKSDVWTEQDMKNLEGIIREIEADKDEAPSYDLPIYDKYS